MNDPYSSARESVLKTVRELETAGLIRMSAGNVSTRLSDDMVAITPTTISYDELVASDISIIDLNGHVIDGARAPSSEWPLHTAIYREMTGIGAVVHTHSVCTMAFAVAGHPIPVVCTEGIFLGGPIEVARFATAGTPEGGDVVLEILRRNPRAKAVLLQNHGLVAIGRDLKSAWHNAFKAEIQAHVYLMSSQIGQPIICTEEQISHTLDVYRAG